MQASIGRFVVSLAPLASLALNRADQESVEGCLGDSGKGIRGLKRRFDILASSISMQWLDHPAMALGLRAIGRIEP